MAFTETHTPYMLTHTPLTLVSHPWQGSLIHTTRTIPITHTCACMLLRHTSHSYITRMARVTDTRSIHIHQHLCLCAHTHTCTNTESPEHGAGIMEDASTGFHMILQSSTHFYRLLHTSTGSRRFPQASTCFDRLPHTSIGFHTLPQASTHFHTLPHTPTGSHRPPQASTHFDRLPHASTGFCPHTPSLISHVVFLCETPR